MSKRDIELAEAISSFLHKSMEDSQSRMPQQILDEIVGESMKDFNEITRDFITSFREAFIRYSQTNTLSESDATKMFHAIIASTLSTFVVAMVPPTQQPILINLFVTSHLTVLEAANKLAELSTNEH